MSFERDRRFESISLQQRVRRTFGPSAMETVNLSLKGVPRVALSDFRPARLPRQ